MKWFKHETDSDKSEGLAALIDEFGVEGYGRWFLLLETVASKMDKTDRCHAEYSISKWCQLLHCKQKQLTLFLELSENKLKIKVTPYENVLRIEIPNLLKKRDEYSRKSGHNPDTLPKKSHLEVDTDVRHKNKDIGGEPPVTPAQPKKQFIKPSLEQILAYCRERKNAVRANKFLNYYESNGWKVGKNPMKDWKAAVRTWEQNNHSQTNSPPPSATGALARQREEEAAIEAERTVR